MGSVVALGFFATFIWYVVAIVCLGWLSVRRNGTFALAEFDVAAWWVLVGTGVLWIGLGIALSRWLSTKNWRALELRTLVLGALVSLGALTAVTFGGMLAYWPAHLCFASIGALVMAGFVGALNRLSRTGVGRWMVATACLAPIVAVAGWVLVLWPAVEVHRPSWVYPIATWEARARIERAFLERVRVGDRLVDLQAALPGFIEGEPRRMGGSGYGYEYRLVFEDGRVTAVSVVSR
jgi:hypothetical protein